MRTIWLVLTLACVQPVESATQSPDKATKAASATEKKDAAPAPVQVETYVDRTALWVGDRATYTVEFRTARDVDILADDLNPDRLRLGGLEIVSFATERDESVPDRVTHRMLYALVTYEFDAPELTVAAIPVRYSIRQPGQRPEDALPAGEIVVPPLTLAVRSTIPATREKVAIRDARQVEPLPRLLRLAQPIGIGLLIVSVLPVALGAARLARRIREARARRPFRRSLKERRAAFEQIKAMEMASDADRRGGYGKLDSWIREQVQHATGIAAAGLTPEELPGALRKPPKSLDVPEVQRLLIECERAKYAPETPPADRWPSMLMDAEQLLGAGRP